ncbi:MAG: P-loop NTPase fold protein [Clostridia bacterium]
MNRDLPISNIQEDTLMISKYVDGMARFIQNCDTPMTISIQGEWGSGKTSFMKLLENKLCIKKSLLSNFEPYESVWIHTWELYLDDNFEVAISKLIMNMFYEIKKIAKEKGVSSLNLIDSVAEEFKRYCLAITKITLGALNLNGDEMVSAATDAFEEDGQLKVRELRERFEKLVTLLLEDKHNKISNKAFIIFVDDLDRIDPKLALTIIEALKNLFDTPGCVFILAVDYDIISRGVAEKYELSNYSSRNLCHDYFDKVIQVPFVMPVRKYDTTKMIADKLDKINYLSEKDNKEQVVEQVKQIISLTMGNNPRSIKRLFNIVHLTNIIDFKDPLQTSQDYKIMLILLIAMQLEYPQIYTLIETSTSYLDWKNNIIFDDDEIPEKAKEVLGIDEEWKEVIYKIASKDEVLQNRCNSLFSLLYMLGEIVENFKNNTDEKIEDILDIIAVTKIDKEIDLPYIYNGLAYDKSSQTQFQQGNNLIDRVDFTKYSNLLDVGCGNGKTTLELLRKNPNLKIDAFDMSRKQIDVAKKHLVEQNLSEKQVNFFVQNALDLNSVNKYDIIFSNATLHWVLPAEEMYTKIYNALTPNGEIAIHQGGEKSYFGLHNMAKRAISELGFEHYFKDWEFPVFYPSNEKMVDMLKKIGFTDIKVISEKTTGKEYDNLIENFAKASLIFYYQKLPNESDQKKLEVKYIQLCNSMEVDTHTHRLYIYAKRGAK